MKVTSRVNRLPFLVGGNSQSVFIIIITIKTAGVLPLTERGGSTSLTQLHSFFLTSLSRDLTHKTYAWAGNVGP